jgi:hypothetical protein
MQIAGRWTYSDEGRKAIHEAGHVAVALCFGIEIGAVTVTGDHDGGAYTEVCDDWIRTRDPKRLEQRAAVAMAGIASDVLYGRNYCVPDCNNSWDQIYALQEGWRPDICKTCCLDWITRNTQRLSDLAVPYETSDQLLAAITNLPGYQMPPRSHVGVYFGKARESLERPEVCGFIEQFAKQLCSQGLLSRNECVRTWEATVGGASSDGR